MQTILGANGQIAVELAKELRRSYTTHLRLVSRNPHKVNETDELLPANLLDQKATEQAVSGSEVAYLTVGLPMSSSLWEAQFPVIMQNVIDACVKNKCKLVFFDNTYMYPKTSEPQTEETAFAPVGRKSVVRAKIATQLLQAMKTGSVEALICRAPEFYGPEKTQSITNTLIFDKIKNNKTAKVPLTDDSLRTLIWTPDASRAMALLGNTAEAFNQCWHLPCDDDRLNYKQIVTLAANFAHKRADYTIIKEWQFRLGSLFNKYLQELKELLPRYRQDNIFISDKFKSRFPGFKVTSYAEGIKQKMQD